MLPVAAGLVKKNLKYHTFLGSFLSLPLVSNLVTGSSHHLIIIIIVVMNFKFLFVLCLCLIGFSWAVPMPWVQGGNLIVVIRVVVLKMPRSLWVERTLFERDVHFLPYLILMGFF